MKQQDVSFFWDGDDLVIAIHNARPDAAAFVSALLMAGGVQAGDSTAEPVPASPYPAPKAARAAQIPQDDTALEMEPGQETVAKAGAEAKADAGPDNAADIHTGPCPETRGDSRTDIVRQVREALETTDPEDYLDTKNADGAFRELSLYWASRDPFRHKEVSIALTKYMTSRFAGVEDAEDYAEKLSDRGVNKFLHCFASAYRDEEQELLRKADMSQKREFIAKLIRRCQKQKKATKMSEKEGKA